MQRFIPLVFLWVPAIVSNRLVLSVVNFYRVISALSVQGYVQSPWRVTISFLLSKVTGITHREDILCRVQKVPISLRFSIWTRLFVFRLFRNESTSMSSWKYCLIFALSVLGPVKGTCFVTFVYCLSPKHHRDPPHPTLIHRWYTHEAVRLNDKRY